MAEFTSRYEHYDRRVPIDPQNCSVIFDVTKCKNCTLCRRACADTQTILDYYSLVSTGDVPVCVHCGQCANACPFGAMEEKSDVEKVKEAIADENRIVVFQTAPAVRVGLGDAFGMEPGAFVEGKMVTALRMLGGDYVFDTDFGADMTIMEESVELLHRLDSDEIPHPQFTSCCPGWVEFCEIYYPELLLHLSSTKSPISILSTAIKTWFAKKENMNPRKIVNVCVTPCTAKKSEIRRPQLDAASLYWDIPDMHDTDICITTRELAAWIKEENIDFCALDDSPFSRTFRTSSGGARIFGNAGGVMEAALRNAYYYVTGNKAPKEFIPFEPVRGLNGVKEAVVSLGDKQIKVAAVNGLGNARKFIDKLLETKTLEEYSFVEVMACPGGCIYGGGQPKVKMPQIKKVSEARQAGLYESDAAADVKASWENPEIQAMYEDFFGEPLSEKAEFLLHTYFMDQSDCLGEQRYITPQTNPMSPKYKPAST